MRKRRKPCIIRYHKFSEAQEEEKFCHHMLMLFHPWRKEESDLKNGHDTYAGHYNEICEKIKERQGELEHYSAQHHYINQAIDEQEEHGPPMHAWDTLDTEGQHQDAAAEDEGTIPHPQSTACWSHLLNMRQKEMWQVQEH